MRQSAKRDARDGERNAATEPAVSRRGVLRRGGVAAAGAVLGASAVGVAGPAQAATAPVDGQAGRIAAEFLTRIEQTGVDFVASGFLSRLAGVDSAKLFYGTTRSESTALLTLSATVKMVGQSIDGAVHALDLEGELAVYQRARGGATYTDPASFRSGPVIARFSLTLHDMLTVIAPETGVPTLTGDMRQTEVTRLTGALGPNAFGRVGQRLRLFGTGLGTRSEPTIPKASLTVAGTLTHV